MTPKKLQQILSNLNYKLMGDACTLISGITSDSRKVKSGYIFVALRKAHENSQDGHLYIYQAIKNKAAAIVVEKDSPKYLELNIPIILVTNSRYALAQLAENFYDNPSQKIKLIGITGTNGKTSTSYFLHSILQHAGYNTRIMGTLGVGEPDNLLPTNFTTLSPEDLSYNLYNFVNKNISHVILEVSSHALALHRVSALKFAACALTNISQDHLDFHKSMENYKLAKSLLFTNISHTSTKLVLPTHHDFNKLLKHKDNLFSWGISQKSNIRFCYPKNNGPQNILNLIINEHNFNINLPTSVKFHLENAVVSAALAYSLGVSHNYIIKGLSQATLPPGRMQQINNPAGPQVFIDYAHTPDSLKKALTELRAKNPLKLIIIFGCGGDRDKQKRPLMGQIAQSLSDMQIICDDNPRLENPKIIREEIIAGMNINKNILNIPDRKQAIKTALKQARAEDIILIAGKGHEQVQIYNNQKQKFCDKKTVLDILKNMRENNHA